MRKDRDLGPFSFPISDVTTLGEQVSRSYTQPEIVSAALNLLWSVSRPPLGHRLLWLDGRLPQLAIQRWLG
jgi:hypothetical protein